LLKPFGQCLPSFSISSSKTSSRGSSIAMSQEPHMAVREIATQLQEDRNKSNLKNADRLVDKIEELKNNASNLSTEPLENMKEVVSSWRDSI